MSDLCLDSAVKIGDEISARWRAALEPSESYLFRYANDLGKTIDESGQTTSRKVKKVNRARLAILDEGILWLSVLPIALEHTLGSDDRRRAAWALCGTACSQAVAIRRLILSGLDIPAVVLRRTMSESLFKCIALIRQADLAKRFVEAQSDEEANRVWSQALRPSRVEKVLAEVETELFGEAHDPNEEFRTWRRVEFARSSQSVHASYISSVLASRPAELLSPDRHTFGLLGVAS